MKKRKRKEESRKEMGRTKNGEKKGRKWRERGTGGRTGERSNNIRGISGILKQY